MPDKAERVYNFHRNTLHALKELMEAAGLTHPSDLRPWHIVRRVSSHKVQLLSDLLDYLEPGDLISGNYRYPVYAKYWDKVDGSSFTLPGLSQAVHRSVAQSVPASGPTITAPRVIPIHPVDTAAPSIPEDKDIEVMEALSETEKA